MKNRIKSDDAFSTTFELMLAMVLLVTGICLIIEGAMYFNNRRTVMSAAQNGARIAAVIGGAEDNPLVRKYGVEKEKPSAKLEKALKTNNYVSRLVLRDLEKDKSGMSLQVQSIECGPAKTTKLGERTYCTIVWDFDHVIRIFREPSTHVVTASAETEVIARPDDH